MSRLPDGAPLAASPDVEGVRYTCSLEEAAYLFVLEGLTNARVRRGRWGRCLELGTDATAAAGVVRARAGLVLMAGQRPALY